MGRTSNSTHHDPLIWKGDKLQVYINLWTIANNFIGFGKNKIGELVIKKRLESKPIQTFRLFNS